MEVTSLVIFLCIGLIAGLMSGIFGIGGGSVRIPLLNLAGLPLLNAFGINLFVIPFSSSIGAITHRKNINRNIVVYVLLGGVLGSIIGAFFTGLIPTIVLAILFVMTAIITVSAIYLDKILPQLSEKINPNKYNLTFFAFFLNFLTGLRGGSGGSLFPPFLRAMKLDIHEAIATSLFVTIFTAIFAMVVYWSRGDIIWEPALLVLIGSIIGARSGSQISLKTKPKWLEIGLSILIIFLALLTVIKAM
ncbi:MAG: sulfite exporter TauE/SafE family protein [Candidatus Hodarchaeales archaeon]